MKQLKAILFDWGDTLMVDFNTPGKMNSWPEIAAVEGARETLTALAPHFTLYMATNAQDSTRQEIEAVLEKVSLKAGLNGVFCKADLGVDKMSDGFYPAILQKLQLEPNQVMMVGDSLVKDITPAKRCGLLTAWLTSEAQQHSDADFVINNLTQLLELTR